MAFSSVAQSCPTLFDPMDRSKQGLLDHHRLPEFTQTHVHWVCDAIQPSHPLSSPSLPAFNLSQLHGFTFIENHLFPKNSISAKFFFKGRPFISLSSPILQGSEAVYSPSHCRFHTSPCFSHTIPAPLILRPSAQTRGATPPVGHLQTSCCFSLLHWRRASCGLCSDSIFRDAFQDHLITSHSASSPLL